MKRFTMAILACLFALVLGSCTPNAGDRTLVYVGATEQSLLTGEMIPGANIRFVGYGEGGAEIAIDDQTAFKKTGDSLDWSGTPVPGVDVKISQRILWVGPEKLQTGGMVTISIEDAAPQIASFPDKPAFSYRVATTYTVRRGENIPGTLIGYAGKSEQGAELSGASGYPYRKLGDSISWRGKLRENAFLDETLRVLAYTDEVLQVGGLAEIGLVE